MIPTGNVWLGALLIRRLAAGLRGRHVLRTTLRSHLAAAVIFVRAEKLRYKTGEARHAEQCQQADDREEFGTQSHVPQTQSIYAVDATSSEKWRKLRANLDNQDLIF